MFAYVRFIDDNVCSIVPTEKIKKFNKNDKRKFDLKYYVQYEDGEYYKANIIYLKGMYYCVCIDIYIYFTEI